MNKLFLLCLFYIFAFSTSLIADDIAGFWKSFDEKTGEPQSVVAIYPYQGKYYGRMIATYKGGKLLDTIDNPTLRAPGVKGHPFYSGMDFIWGLEKNDLRYSGGKILDPEEGKEYNAEMWMEDGNLIVRGEILIFGRNQTWVPATAKDLPQGFKLPNLNNLTPVIPDITSE